MHDRHSLNRYLRLIEPLVGSTDTISFAAMDAQRHARRVSKPLSIYSQLLLAEQGGPCDSNLLASTGQLDNSLWSELARLVAGEIFDRPAWIDRSRQAFLQVVHQQQPSGEFLPADSHANPEARWYEELTILHAVSSYSIREQDESIQAAVARSAAFHLHEIQPDHATAEPWGLLPFIQYAPPLADQVLHAMSMQYPQRVSGTALLLLADVLYGLRRLIRAE